MIVMASNNASGLVNYLAGKCPGKIGWMMSPGGFKEPREWLPYALDNGAFSAWTNGTEWNEQAFFDLLDRCQLSRYKPQWIVMPDKVADCEQTLWLWQQYESKLRRYKCPLAFAVQDGMTPRDVPKSADVVFIGGTTRWKWRNVGLFVAQFPRVHVGRVNWWDKLEYCERIGIESVDGTGFFREGEAGIQAQQLRDFVEGVRRGPEQPELFLHAM